MNVLGGTPWLWCREEFRDSIHCLFVDEAGQMSLANVLACAPAGKNLVLRFSWVTLSSWSNHRKAAIRKVRTSQRSPTSLIAEEPSMKNKGSFSHKRGGFTLRSAASHQSFFMRDDSRHLMALNDRLLKRPGLSREQVCGLCLSCTRAIGAIRQKRSRAWPRLSISSRLCGVRLAHMPWPATRRSLGYDA